MIPLVPGGRPAIIGHRGASAGAPENTIAAFRLAAEQGADGVELDVRRTADFSIIVHHDAAVEGLGPIVDASLEEIRRHAPSIPTLAEALGACRGLLVDIEIKSWRGEPDWDPGYRVAGGVVDLIRRRGTADRVLVTSFDLGAVDAVRSADPSITTGWLHDDRITVADLEGLAEAGHRAILPAVHAIEDAPALAAAARRHALWVIAWTVDDPAEVKRMAAAGIDGIITNDPASALRAVAR